MKLILVMPAHNEAASIGDIIQKVIDLDLGEIQKEILVVDDGSHDRTGEIARSKGATVIRHLIKRGLGGALGTGIAAAIKRDADMIVTFDADGQHAPEDIPNILSPIVMRQADVVIGSRMLQTKGMPWERITANRLANFFTALFFGIHVTDSQSGLRGFSRHAAKLIRIETNNYEVSSEICGEIKRHRLKLKEVPIQAIYTDYSLAKGQSFINGLKTLVRLFYTRLLRK